MWYNNIMKKLFITALIIGGLVFGYNKYQESQISVGGDLLIGGQNYTLNQSVSSTDVAITLSSFTIPQSGAEITDSYIGDIEYGTIEPGNSSRQEFISFTGITQNADGTATLTGVARGLAPVTPYTASTTYAFSHAGSVRFIISDAPSKWDRVAFKSNDEAVTGLWNFNSYLPTSSITATSSNQLANKTYVDNVVNAGAATSTESNGGIVELATQLEMASSTDGGVLKPLVLQAKYSTSTPDGTSQAGLYVPISKNNGKLHQLWLDLTEDFTFTGHNIFSSVFSTNASSTNATTTNQTITGVVSSLLKTDSNGLVTSATAGTDYQQQQYTFGTATDLTTTGTATSTAMTIPANIMTASSSIAVQGTFTSAGTSNCTISIKKSSTYEDFVTGVFVATGGTNNGIFDSTILNNNSVSSQISFFKGLAFEDALGTGDITKPNTETTSSIDTSNEFTLAVNLASAGDSCTVSNYTIIVTP